MENQNLSEEFTHGKALLRDALRNAELLLAHAAEYGLDIAKKDVQTIIEAKHQDENGQIAKETEIDFWIAYTHVAQKVKPASIDSLHASEPRHIVRPNWWQRFIRRGRKPSYASLAVRYYTLFALLNMALLLIIHVYSIKGTTLINNIQSNNDRMAQVSSRLNDLGLIIQNNTQDRSAVHEKGQLETELEEKTMEVNSSTKLLSNWLSYSDFLRMTSNGAESAEKVLIGPEPEPALPDFSNNEIEDNVKVIQEAKNLVLILGLYILPLLYGLLGGCALVLRILAEETKSLTFSKSSNIYFLLRIVLSAVAGLAVGLFWGDIEKHQAGMIESLSPLFMAFIAGYSVEFFFRLIDRFIVSIAEKKAPHIAASESSERTEAAG